MVKPSFKFFFRDIISLAIITSTTLFIGCKKVGTVIVPTKIVFDRHSCAHCGMLVSDKKFSSQILDHTGKRHFFDNIGCSVEWQKDHPKIKTKGHWVIDIDTANWIDATKAVYEPNLPNTPMGYGYGAHKKNKNSAKNWIHLKKLTDDVIRKANDRRN